MRVRITTKPTVECIDGVQLTRFHRGSEYEVSSQLAELLIVEGWAEPMFFDAAIQPTTGEAGRSGRRDRRSNIMRGGR